MTKKKRSNNSAVVAEESKDLSRREMVQNMGKAVYAAPLLVAINQPFPRDQQDMAGSLVPPPPPNG